MKPEREVSIPLTLSIGEYVMSANAAARTLAEQAALPQYLVADAPCFYCTLPEGYDACPIHRDGE